MSKKVLNICFDDYANFSHDNANALRSVGIQCDDVKLMPHVFKYDSESQIIKSEQIPAIIREYDIIQLMHSFDVLRFIPASKRVIVYHTGTAYRQNPDFHNNIFNKRVERSIIALGEFAGLGAKNETYMVGAIDCDKLNPGDYRMEGPVKVYHLPSNPKVKGTETIIRIVDQIRERQQTMKAGQFDFLCKTDTVPHHQQLELMRDCDIYLELFAPLQGGKKYGSWGITALEAAALGKVVFTNHSTRNIYKSTYGTIPALEAWEDETVFKNRLFHLINAPDLIEEIQWRTREWVKHYHSYFATGNHLRTLLNI